MIGRGGKEEEIEDLSDQEVEVDLGIETKAGTSFLYSNTKPSAL